MCFYWYVFICDCVRKSCVGRNYIELLVFRWLFMWWCDVLRFFFAVKKQNAITKVVNSLFNGLTTFCVDSIEDWRRPHLEQNNWASISYIEQKPFVSDSVNFVLGLFSITFVFNKVFKVSRYFKPSWKKMKFFALGLWTINNIFLCFA